MTRLQEAFSMPRTNTRNGPQLLTTAEAAELLSVSVRTVQGWIKDQRIPFVQLPSGMYRIPLQALLASLGGTYDLADDVGTDAPAVDHETLHDAQDREHAAKQRQRERERAKTGTSRAV